MSAVIEIQDQPSGLAIHVSEPPRFGRILLGLSIGGAVTYLFIHNAGSRLLQLSFGLFCMIAVLRDALCYLRGTDVTLTIGNLDFVSSGHAPGGYGPSVVSRADIYNLEFRKASGGGEDEEYPQGLYADHGGSIWDTGVCLLPHINQAQTEEVLQAIYRRYPDTGTLGPSGGPYKSDLISLNLSQPTKAID